MPDVRSPRRTARNVGVGVVLAGVVVGAGIGVREQLQGPADPAPPQATAKALDGPLLRDGFEGRGGGAPVPPINPCADPLVAPAGWPIISRTWEQCFTPRDGSPVPTYPYGLGFAIPLGALKGSYTLCSFVAQPNQTTTMFWDSAQAKPNEGYPVARPALSMFLSISACPGDFRMVQGCSKVADSGTLITTTTGQVSSSSCPLVAGQRYYLLAAPVDPRDGLTLGEHTCRQVPSSENECHIQARATAR